jgi:tetratricopeptide (TPR) repeat protein
MKRILLILSFSFFYQVLLAQSKIDSLVQLGIEFHDKGEYDNAIDAYKKALELDANSGLIHYEIALSYMYAKDYDNAMSHSDKVIALNDNKYLMQAFNIKGSCLDYLGRTDESIALFEQTIKKFGPDHFLYYNLGYNYYKKGNHEKAEDALSNAIKTKPSHASSHLLLAYLMNDQKNKVKSLLSLHYFLLLDPASERSRTAYALLKEQFEGAKKDEKSPNSVTIFYDPKTSDKEFGSVDLMISMLDASRTFDENKNKSEDEMFISNTKSFFTILGELKKKKSKGLWWEFYVPFFYDLARTEHMDAYCYYISKSSNSLALLWLSNNADKVESFGKWVKEKTTLPK